MPRTIFVVAKDSFIHWLVGCSVVVVIAAAVSGCPSNDSSVLQAISKQCNSDAADSCAPPKLLGQLVQSQPLDPASAISERYFGANGDLVQADHGAYVIEIDRRAMSDAELWLLTEPVSYTHLRAHETPEH